MCMQYFSADELTTGVKNTQRPHMIILYSPEFGGWSNEQLRHPLYTLFSHVRTMFTCALCAFIQSVRPYDEL